MNDALRIGIYGIGVVSGFGLGAAVASLVRRWARPAITVCRCASCRAAGPHVDAVGLHYDDDGRVDVISLCCVHKAKELWEAEEREDAPAVWRWPQRVNGFRS